MLIDFEADSPKEKLPKDVQTQIPNTNYRALSLRNYFPEAEERLPVDFPASNARRRVSLLFDRFSARQYVLI